MRPADPGAIISEAEIDPHEIEVIELAYRSLPVAVAGKGWPTGDRGPSRGDP